MSDPIRAIARRVMAVPMIPPEDEPALLAAAKAGNRRASNRLIEAHLRMPLSAAMRNRRYGLPVEDLYQAGCLGLLVALDRFDPKHDVRFATYARWYVDSEIQEFIMRNVSAVRVTKTAGQRTLFFNLRRERGRLEGEMPGAGPAAINDALAAHFGVPLADVERLSMALDGGDWSLDAGVSEGDGASFADFLADTRPGPEEIVMEAHDGGSLMQRLWGVVGALPERDQVIVARRTLADEPITLEAMGAELGISKERVRQLEMRAVRTVATKMAREVA